MTYPRSHLIDPNGGTYHICSRCVRRAYLCGRDRETGYDFNHRRQWIEDRILKLASIFAVDVLGYAVMSNHYHLVLKIDPKEVDTWADSEIVNKWFELNPRKGESDIVRDARKLSVLKDVDRLLKLRERLGSLSWFMRYLNEPLARLANKEDCCTGRFWEGRFKSQKLLDEHAILACMVYVDLNPVRAGLTDDPLQTEHTSLMKRVNEGNEERDQDEPMRPVGAVRKKMSISCSLNTYKQLISWTLEAQGSKRVVKLRGLPPPDFWLLQYMPRPGSWQRAQGSTSSLKEYAKDLGQRWIKTNLATAWLS